MYMHMCTYVQFVYVDKEFATADNIYMHVYIYVSIYIYTYEHAPDAKSICVYVHPIPHTAICACTCMYVCMYACIYTHVNMYVCVFGPPYSAQVCMFAYVYMYVCMYTQTGIFIFIGMYITPTCM